MTDATLIALLSSIAPTLAALGAVVIGILNARKSNETGIKVDSIGSKSDKTDAKVDTVIEKAVEIHTATNSNLSKVTAALDKALEKISGLEKMVALMNRAKDVADRLAAVPVAIQPQAAAIESLQKIDENTKAIEINTSKTDAKLDAIHDPLEKTISEMIENGTLSDKAAAKIRDSIKR